MKSTIVLVSVLLILCLTQTPPVWPQQFQINFDQKTTTGKTAGKIIYDAKNNREVVERTNGHFDRYCATVQKLANTPCNHIVVNGSRYLDFPAKKYCCFCCNSEHGCGITRRDWLNEANYQGLEKIDNVAYQKWEIKGLQENYYYNTHDEKRIPKRLLQSPNDNMDFDTNSYVLEIKDDSVFNVPSYCKQKCGALTICAGLRGEKPQQIQLSE